MQGKISKISADPKGCKKANLGEINLVHLNENSPARNRSQEPGGNSQKEGARISVFTNRRCSR